MKLFSKKDLENLVVLDIETVSGYASTDDMSDRLSALWSKRCEYLRVKHADNEGLTDNEIYLKKAGLQAEYGKIVCITIGYLRYVNDEPVIKLKTYSNDDESILLEEFFKFITQLKSKLPDSRLCGHALKRFDIPYICKRGLINGLELPSLLVIHDKKPWELTFVDTADIWSHGAWQEGFTSLDTLTCVLGIPSPKSDIDGSEVGHVYWVENDLPRIVRYCENDVSATLQVMMRLGGFELPKDENIIIV